MIQSKVKLQQGPLSILKEPHIFKQGHENNKAHLASYRKERQYSNQNKTTSIISCPLMLAATGSANGHQCFQCTPFIFP